MKTWVDELSRLFGPQANPVGKYSQSYQDSLLDFVFENLAPPSNLRTCVEFGFNSKSLIGGSGANVAKLVVKHGWRYWLFDAEFENTSINLFKEFLSPQNITQVFDAYEIPRELGYISIDVDSIDYWLFASLLKTHRPLVFSVEYNANLPRESYIALRPGAPSEPRSRRYGASLSGLAVLAQAHQYELLWVVPTLDAFFIRADMLPPGYLGKHGSDMEFEYVVNRPTHLPMDRMDLKFFCDVSIVPETLDMLTPLTGAQRQIAMRTLTTCSPVPFGIRWKLRRPLFQRFWRKVGSLRRSA